MLLNCKCTVLCTCRLSVWTTLLYTLRGAGSCLPRGAPGCQGSCSASGAGLACSSRGTSTREAAGSPDRSSSECAAMAWRYSPSRADASRRPRCARTALCSAAASASRCDCPSRCAAGQDDSSAGRGGGHGLAARAAREGTARPAHACTIARCHVEKLLLEAAVWPQGPGRRPGPCCAAARRAKPHLRRPAGSARPAAAAPRPASPPWVPARAFHNAPPPTPCRRAPAGGGSSSGGGGRSVARLGLLE
jgi:hypothetical protein